jgi:hypothetical protein
MQMTYTYRICNIAIFCWISSLLICGCSILRTTAIDTVITKTDTAWTDADIFRIIEHSMNNNFINPNQIVIKANATAYFPTTILAIEKKAQIDNHWSRNQFRVEADLLLQHSMGIYYDWDSSRYVDKNGNYITSYTQFESLEFMLTLVNTQYPCVPPVINKQTYDIAAKKFLYRTEAILTANDYPCQIYLINDLKSRIHLINDIGQEVLPTYILGRAHEQLTMTETLFIKFPLRTTAGEHLFARSDKLCLRIDGFNEGPIQLEFPIEKSYLPLTTVHNYSAE